MANGNGLMNGDGVSPLIRNIAYLVNTVGIPTSLLVVIGWVLMFQIAPALIQSYQNMLINTHAIVEKMDDHVRGFTHNVHNEHEEMLDVLHSQERYFLNQAHSK